MPQAGTRRTRRGRLVDYYEISVRQFEQQVLPAGLPATILWGYGPVAAARRGAPMIFNAPSLTIEARWRGPIRVRWINDLVDANGNYRPHLLPVDPTLHWANPGGGEAGRDTRPMFDETPGSYTGPVPLVTHAHGAVGVEDHSDGYPEAWYLPDTDNIPAGYATHGTWYELLRHKGIGSWDEGEAVFEYPNLNRASTLWYHDHTLGMTRLHVYAGPAGFYLVRGGPSGDGALIDTRFGTRATLPGPAPKAGDRNGSRKRYYEIPIAIQDRSFNVDGSLFYPDTRAFFDGVAGDLIPGGPFSPIWNPEFFGNTLMVNGNTWPYQTVEQRRYRLRFLNGCQSRLLILDFGQIPGVEVWQIGNEGGFLAAPVNVTDRGNLLLLGLAERADVVVDFTGVPVGRSVLGNVGPDEPFGGGEPDVDFDRADPGSTGQVMEFRVVPATQRDPSTPPRFLRLPAIAPLPAADRVRPVALIEQMGMGYDAGGAEVEGPTAALLGDVDASGTPVDRMWMDPVTENPRVGDTETWEIYNTTGDAHPIRVHEVTFAVLDRQDLLLDPDTEAPSIPLTPNGPARPPEPGESGFKDTVTAYPGQVTRIKATFSNPGQFVWHCHIVEHEDNGMMRPMRVGPEQPGQPGQHGQHGHPVQPGPHSQHG